MSNGAWEYSITHSDRLSNVSGIPQVSSIWRTKYADETTDLDYIQRMGSEGWELVSAFPVSANGTTLYVTFIFKRPVSGAIAPATPAATEGDEAG